MGLMMQGIEPSDDIPGRARVRDAPELESCNDDLAQNETAALWSVANAIEPCEPTPVCDPVLWKWDRLRADVLRSIDLIRPKDAGRRVVYLRNPKRKDVSASCGWGFSGIQTMKAGKRAGAHRHAASALRFIMEDSGAYTIVEGHKMSPGARDFVLTPNGMWHEHCNTQSGDDACLFSIHDLPTMCKLGFYAERALEENDGHQVISA